jgi:ribosome biogenesis protein BMS1
MGVLTHLDHYKQSKQLKKTKKRMKKRFWKEVYEGAKLFYLSGVRYEMYWKNEIRNLARYISVIKVKPLEWKSHNPYILVDRYDISPTVKQDDKTLVSFYGYVRGNAYNKNHKSYITGLGDYTMSGISILSDPCPTLAVEKLEREKAAKKKRRTLNQKEKILYAPMTNLDFASIDHSNGYITIPDKYVFYTDMPGVQKREGGEAQEIMKQLQEPSKTLDEQFNSAAPEILPGLEVDAKEEEVEEMEDEEIKVPDIELDEVPETLAETIKRAIYGEVEVDVNEEDVSRFRGNKLLSQEEYVRYAKKKFITGVDPLKVEEKDKVSEEEEDSINESNDEEIKDEKEKKWVELKRPEVKREEVDDKVKEYQNAETGIYTKGKYLKLDTMIENKYLAQFFPQFPILVCGFHQQEGNIGYLRTRLKKHRWYPKVLKTFDPLIISIGWRRLQTIFTYVVEDPNERRRVIKYTPKFDFCQGICYGPLFSQHTAFLGIQTISDDAAHFRVAATGDVLEVAQHFPVMKKLKLIGEPMKVFKNTAFVKGMFNSKVEVAKYVGAAVRTVSGIRGQIKKAVNEGPEGTFRATFEDKIQLSDLVFCRTWYQIKLPQLYNPITSYGR